MDTHESPETLINIDVAASTSQFNRTLVKLHYLFRLAKDLHYLDLRRYEFAARALEEIGRMVGGWKKASHVQEA